MAEVLLFHHAHGLTQGVHNFAEQLKRAGHSVHVPDLYDGNVFDDLDDGLAYAQGVGFDTILERGRIAGEGLPTELDAARALVDATTDADLFLYPGSQHLFAVDSLPSYDEQATKLLTERVLSFLAAVV